MVLSLFKRKNNVKSVDNRLAIFTSKISEAFLRIREDISASEQRAEASDQELQKLNQWVGYLYHNQQQLSSNHSKLLDKHKELQDNHSKLSRNHSSLSKSIDLKHSQVKSDISGVHSLSSKELENVKEWIKHFAEKVDTQRDIESKLRKDVLALQTQMFGVMSELREEISTIKTENVKLHEKMEAVKTPEPQMVEKIIEIEKPAPMQPLEEPRYTPAQNKFEQQVLARVRPNRKNYVMQQIIALIEDNKYSTKDVEDIIVKEKQLCGRTSFYSYLKELRHRGKINYADLGDRTVLVRMDK